ncbi:S8 family serine peptidase [Allorhizocola rhizosphaerae]|uniref:S8 family serine peptidase n=1 Tax=Allorhizocola rhizosphaerae TaxID=1872709 RepID=UPI000E3E337D|nr:S8 family serine peptidase [Allorhizocola rhizosphaerae]
MTRVLKALLCAAMAGALVQPPPALAAAPTGAPIFADAGDRLHTVTLITGDRVTVADGEGGLKIVRIDGRKGITFSAYRSRNRLLVLPRDAIAPLAANRLDKRLFDVAALLEYGYDDARRKELPLIVGGGVPMRAAKQSLTSQWRELAKSGKVWLDGMRKPVLKESVPQIGAPQAWQAGYDGTGITVGVVDTGVDANHPDLAGKVVAAQDFVGDGHDRDLVGHGTHVAATIASTGEFRGVAPGAKLVSAKVCMAFGCPESAILAGMRWAVDQGAKVINMSLGGTDTPDIDPVEALVNELTAQRGVLFVISAGNAGGDATVGSPGSADAALTVGAVTKTDELADFSSRGPRIGDGAIKPDVTAPGVDIVAARSADGRLGEPGQSHMSLSGTSMAAPHAAGAAAILAQQNPAWGPTDLKAALMSSAVAGDGIGVFGQGAGRVDLTRAVRQQVIAETPSLSFGVQLWPHTDDVPITRAVTYRNRGPADVTLGLRMTGGAPAGLFTLSADSVTVPAGGSATVNLTADTRIDIPDTVYSGHLVATDTGGVAINTPFAVDKDTERYAIDFRITDRAGQPAQDAALFLVNTTNDAFIEVYGGSQTARLPKGTYVGIFNVYEDASATALFQAEVVADRDRTVEVDARRGRPVSITVPFADAQPNFVVASTVVQHAAGGAIGFLAWGEPDGPLYTASLGQQRHPAVDSLVVAQYQPADASYVAQLAWLEPGRLFDGLTKRLSKHDLATVRASHAAAETREALLRFGPTWQELKQADNPIDPGAFFTIPSTHTEYVNTDGGVRWQRTFYQVNDASEQALALFGPPVQFRAGREYSERRGQAVFGPGFTGLAPFGVSRRGDTLTLYPTVLNDQLNWAGVSNAEFRMTLDRDGVRIVDSAQQAVQVGVPAKPALYRLSAEQAGVSCVWEFRSGRSYGPLPLSAVRFLPDLDLNNAAPAGRAFAIPFEVQRQPGSKAGAVRTLTVDVSYDDGASWRAVPLTRQGQQGVAHLVHPGTPGYVSLRASSVDTEGNTVHQTMMRAYRIG